MASVFAVGGKHGFGLVHLTMWNNRGEQCAQWM
jgi:hypothetical protein